MRVWTRAEMWVALAFAATSAVAAVAVVVVGVRGPLVLWSSTATSGASSSTTSLELQGVAVGPVGVAVRAVVCAGAIAGCVVLWAALLPRARGRRAQPIQLPVWQLAGLRVGALAAVGSIALGLTVPPLGLNLVSILLALYLVDCFARTAQEAGQWLFFRHQTS